MLPSTREARRADDPRKPGTHTYNCGDMFNLPKSNEGKALDCSLEMWPQVQVPRMPVVVLFYLLCASAPYLQNWSMESENGFGGRDLWRLLIQIPTLGQAHAFVWVSFEYLQGYKSPRLSGVVVQSLTSLLLENVFLTSDLNFAATFVQSFLCSEKSPTPSSL